MILAFVTSVAIDFETCLHCLDISLEATPLGFKPPAGVAHVWTVYTPEAQVQLYSPPICPCHVLSRARRV